MHNIAGRDSELKEMLQERRQTLLQDIQNRLRAGRSGPAQEIRDAVEQSDADTQGDLALALLQSRSEALARVDHALLRLETGTYGVLGLFAAAVVLLVAQPRLARTLPFKRALPFAVRCRACEAAREREQAPRRRADQGHGFPLFPDPAGP